jgi:Kef-type K+ transport system membrane component KefB
VDAIAQNLITLGGLFLLGLLTDLIGRHTPLPRVTLLILLGVAIGPSALALLPQGSESWFPLVANMALVMVGFLLGGSLARSAREHGREIVTISLWKMTGAFVAVAGGLLLVGVRWELAALLGAIATATAPAAIADVVHELRATGRFADTLLGVVALDDAWGLILFSLCLAALESINGQSGLGPLVFGVREVGGAVVLGAAVGAPMAFLTGRVERGEPTLVEALGGVFLCGGLAMWLEVSFLLAAMVQGAVVAALARHHRRPFDAIEGIEWPFMIVFFVLAGASLHVASLATLGPLVLIYFLLRSSGTVIGTRLGARISGAGSAFGSWLGLALLPQAGVATGMALIASQRFPELAGEILTVVLAATALFELVGPILARYALRHAGEGS